KTPMDTLLNVITNQNDANVYLSNNKLVTVEESNGNMVAAVEKTGAGYVSATSKAISVNERATYSLSIDYKTAYPTDVIDGTENKSQYYGVNIAVGFVDASGDVSVRSLSLDYAFRTSWKNVTKEFVVPEGAKEVIIYLWTGSAYNYYITTYFDNVSLVETAPAPDYTSSEESSSIESSSEESSSVESSSEESSSSESSSGDTSSDAVSSEPEVNYGPNLDFEEGTVGDVTPSWTKTPMTNAGQFSDEVSFINSFTLTTALDNGSKVLSVSKSGSGYIGATSTDIPVTAGKTYTASVFYKQVAFDIGGAISGIQDMNNRLYIGEKNAAGQVTLTKNIHGGTNSDWTKLSVEFTTRSDTVSVVIYLWVGAQWNVDKTVYFDNVSVSEKLDDISSSESSSEESSTESSSEEVSSEDASSDTSSENVSSDTSSDDVSSGTSSDSSSSEPDDSDYGLNLDFEEGTVGERTPSWTKTPMSNNGQFSDDTTFPNSFTFTTINDNGNKVLAVTKNGSGYIGATSKPIVVSASATYTVSALYKQVAFNIGNSTVGIEDMNTRLYVGEKNAAGNITLTTNIHGGTASNWSELSTTFKTRSDTTEIIIYLWVGAQWNVNKTVYFDNVKVLRESAIDEWISESCKESAIPREDDYTDYYGIKSIDGSATALQLYVKRSEGVLGGVVYYSSKIPVIGGESYTTSFDSKIEGSRG
ncbi:MAG: hypothetical protein J6V50_05185, partial [Clostridia bacterium]|nr:hypothetical protein [Clostridia bacterium]